MACPPAPSGLASLAGCWGRCHHWVADGDMAPPQPVLTHGLLCSLLMIKPLIAAPGLLLWATSSHPGSARPARVRAAWPFVRRTGRSWMICYGHPPWHPPGWLQTRSPAAVMPPGLFAALIVNDSAKHLSGVGVLRGHRSHLREDVDRAVFSSSTCHTWE